MILNSAYNYISQLLIKNIFLGSCEWPFTYSFDCTFYLDGGSTIKHQTHFFHTISVIWTYNFCRDLSNPDFQSKFSIKLKENFIATVILKKIDNKSSFYLMPKSHPLFSKVGFVISKQVHFT